MLRLSANLGFLWPDLPLLARIDAAAAAGFEAVELHWPYDVPAAAVRAACARNGVALLGINTPVGSRPGDFGLAAVPGREAEFAEGLRKTFDYAAAAGATAIHVMAGVVARDERPRAAAVIAENLRWAADAAAGSGITLLLEPINHRDRPGYFYDTVEEAEDVIRAVGSAAIRLMFDCYHIAISQGDVAARLKRALPAIGHIQIAAVPSRAEPDEGELNYADILRTIEALPYEGWVGCEYRPRGDTDAGLAWRERLAAGR